MTSSIIYLLSVLLLSLNFFKSHHFGDFKCHISFWSNNIPLKIQSGGYKQSNFPFLNKLFFWRDYVPQFKYNFGEDDLCFNHCGYWACFFLRSLEFGRIELNSKESVYYSAAICLEGRSQKSKYCSWRTPAEETFWIHKGTSQFEKNA